MRSGSSASHPGTWRRARSSSRRQAGWWEISRGTRPTSSRATSPPRRRRFSLPFWTLCAEALELARAPSAARLAVLRKLHAVPRHHVSLHAPDTEDEPHLERKLGNREALEETGAAHDELMHQELCAFAVRAYLVQVAEVFAVGIPHRLADVALQLDDAAHRPPGMRPTTFSRSQCSRSNGAERSPSTSISISMPKSRTCDQVKRNGWSSRSQHRASFCAQRATRSPRRRQAVTPSTSRS